MGYLITHIAVFLVFAQLLGLLLGWLFWGYPARQRRAEVESLRERLAELPSPLPRMALAGEPRVALPSYNGPMEPEAPLAPLPLPVDLEIEIKDARLKHFEKQVRELEEFRDRLPLLQAQLSEALTARRNAEHNLEVSRHDFEGRLDNLLAQIRQFEVAAHEWDRTRDEFERARIAHEKELSAAKTQLRDIQNNQLPQRAEPAVASSLSPLEHADLRERHQKALLERNAIAAEFQASKQRGEHEPESASVLMVRIAALEETLRLKEANLADQASQVETLLWRVAELEPFALELPQLEENLRRQEAEISGHVAMHNESSDHIRSLLNRAAELEEEAALLRNQLQSLQERLAGNDQDLQQLRAALTNAEAVKEQAVGLQQSLSDAQNQTQRLQSAYLEREAQVGSMRAAHDELASELQLWMKRNLTLEPLAAKVPELEEALNQQTLVRQNLNEQLSQQKAELEQTLRDQKLAFDQLSEHLSAARQHIAELEPLAAKAPETEQKLAAMEERHQSERTRLQIHSAQRLRRLRQGITNFKG